MVVQVTACHFGLVLGKWGMAGARQDLRPTGTPGIRVGGSTLTCLGWPPHSWDNRSCLVAEAEALRKSLVPAYTPMQTTCSPHPEWLLLLVCLLWRLPGLSSLVKLEIIPRKSTEHLKHQRVMVHKPPSHSCSLLALPGLGWRKGGCTSVQGWWRINHSFSFPTVKPAGGNERTSSEGRTWPKGTEKFQVVTMGTLQVPRPQSFSISLPDGWERPVVKPLTCCPIQWLLAS